MLKAAALPSHGETDSGFAAQDLLDHAPIGIFTAASEDKHSRPLASMPERTLGHEQEMDTQGQ